MYRIALCDDETEELDKTESILQSYQEQNGRCGFSVERFDSADGLLQAVSEGEYAPDLLFMDIYMPGKPGIAAARELRGMGNGCRIIFLTSSTEHALDAFRVDADQYLVKPVQEKELFPVLDKLLGSVERERKKYLPLRMDNRIHRVALHDIIYCEAQKKQQCIHMADGTKLYLRMTMAKIYEMLSGYHEFVRVGASYIINLEHVDSLNAQEIQMDSGKKVYMPRGAYRGVREQYFDYYCEEEEEECSML